MKKRLRLGIMCKGLTLEEWQAVCVRKILALGYVDLALLIIDDGALIKKRSLFKTPLKRWLYTIYRRSWFKKSPRRLVDMGETFRGVDSFCPTVYKKGKFSQYFDGLSIDKIRSYKPDMILRFGFNIIRGEILDVATYGVWSYHHDDEMKYRGSPACFWEIYNDDPVTGAVLQRLTDRLDGGVILKKGFFKTINYSYSENMGAVYTETAGWPAQVCRDIYVGGAGYFSSSPSCTGAKIYYPPKNGQLLYFFIKLFINRLRHEFTARYKKDTWNIGVVSGNISNFLEPGYEPKVEWLATPPKGKFYADPFPLNMADEGHVLFEHFDFNENKAEIACAHIGGDNGKNEVKKINTISNNGVHLSYPYTFEYEGELYCVPESYKENNISLYRLRDHPHSWEKVKTLVHDLPGIDPTLFEHNERWWLFCTDKYRGSKHNLYIYHADNLLGTWSEHLVNPVKTDVRSSRPAGTPFKHDGKLYRPAQNCSKTYGGSVTIMRIDKLSENDFSEEAVANVGPLSPYLCGIHTLSHWGDKTLIDGKRSLFKWQV